MEDLAYSTLKNNHDQSIINNNQIINYDYERSLRAKAIIDDSINESENEWLQLMNAFIFVDYNIIQQIDFNYYTITYDLHENEEKSPFSIIYNQFIDKYLNQAIDLHESLKDFIYNIHINSRSNEWLDVKGSNSTLQTLTNILHYFIDHLLVPSFAIDFENNDPYILVSHIQSFISSHFNTNLSSSINLSFPSSVIKSLFPHMSILSVIKNHSTFNVSSSLYMFNQLFKSHYLTIPIMIYVQTNNRLIETTTSLTINPGINNITSLEQVFSNVEIKYEKQTQNIKISTTSSDTLNKLSSLLISCYNNQNLIISTYIHDSYYRELFSFASTLFNSLHVTESINIIKYLSNFDILNQSSPIIDNLHDKSTNSSFNILNQKRNVKYLMDSQPPIEPTTFDTIYYGASTITKRHFLSFLLLFSILSIIIYFVISSTSLMKTERLFPTTQQESFILMKNLHGGK